MMKRIMAFLAGIFSRLSSATSYDSTVNNASNLLSVMKKSKKKNLYLTQKLDEFKVVIFKSLLSHQRHASITNLRSTI